MVDTTMDRIEKQVVVRAPRSRVWRAITDAKEFGQWFRAEMKDPFVAGAVARGRITYPGYEHLKLEVLVERMEPEHLFSYRWHPYDIERKKDFSSEPTTLVAFELSEVPEGTLVKLTESGFDQIPVALREESFRRNSGGWDEQMKNIAQYLG